MFNNELAQANIDGIANLLSQYIVAKTEEEFTEDEERGVIKLLVYLIKMWEGDAYGDN